MLAAWSVLDLSYAVIFLPLAAALVTGLFGRLLGRTISHLLAIGGVLCAFLASLLVYWNIVIRGETPLDTTLYLWLAGSISEKVAVPSLQIGLMVDALSATMMVVVSFISLMVHIYSVGYMQDDDGYQRFFSYISLFTFSMLVLVVANNFLQLFFGWEMVGLVSYLLIGFWFKRPTAIRASLKAFLVNRVGDVGFLLGIAGVLLLFGSLDYHAVFSRAMEMPASHALQVAGQNEWLLTIVTVCLFIGAMAKSAQVPLHSWLPDSMEGPTPISALIHAATMVTAGIFMVARLSPLFELTPWTLQFILVVGAITALSMGLVALVQHDIKRVIAYSTLSQLGYMVVALGAHAYSAAIFHLVTHAFFKALLFLAAGSVIIAMHHEQDLRRMGGLYRYMPITWICALIGLIALIGFPGTSGFFSKEAIILSIKLYAESVSGSAQILAWFSYCCVLLGVLVTTLYSCRFFLLAFHGEEKMDKEHWKKLRESPLSITFPLVMLAVGSLVVGALFVGSYVSPTDIFSGLFYSETPLVPHTGFFSDIWHAMHEWPLYMMVAGIVVAWLCYVRFPFLPEALCRFLPGLHRLLVSQYGFDALYQQVIATSTRAVSRLLDRVGESYLIDGFVVNGSARLVHSLAFLLRRLQSGYLYHYTLFIVAGLTIWLLILMLSGSV